MEEGAPPSDYAIEALVRGRPGGLPRTLGLTAKRTLFIAPGLYLAGIRGRQLFWGSVAASVTITLGMIAVRAARKSAERARLPASAEDSPV